MFSRVHYEDWHTVFPIVAFFLTFTVFIYFTVRAMQMRRNKADALSNLPLENDDTPQPRKP
jgi:hypothetical protein